MKLLPIPAFADNYIWMLHDSNAAWVVDPGEAQPVLQALQREGLHLAGILVTHHHADHTGGVAALSAASGAAVFAPASTERVAPVLGLAFERLEVPGHTADHIAWYCPWVDTSPLLFCGDVLFSAGCGRLFEGTAAQMQASLHRLAALPDDTQVCCAHEYTLSNVQFALAVEPDNADLQAYHTQVQALRQQGLPSLPSTIAQERRINPFLRSHLPALAAAAGRYDAQSVATAGVFATLRLWKDHYRC